MWLWMTSFCMTGLLGIGSYLGYVYHDNIQGILKVQDTFAKEKRLHNTVLPESLSAYIPQWALSWLETGKFVLDHVWTLLEQSLLGSCVPLDEERSIYRVRFMIHHKLYYLAVRPITGPIDLTVWNSEGDEVTHRISPYILGAKALMEASTTPKQLVAETLTPKVLLNETRHIDVFSMHDPETPLRIDADQRLSLISA